MKGNIGQLMKQAQQMQENMRRMQESLGTLEVEGQSGAGMVRVQMTCKHEVKRVTIDPSLGGDDREMLEDLLAAAFNDAAHKVDGADDRTLLSIQLTEGLEVRRSPLPPEPDLRGRLLAARPARPGDGMIGQYGAGRVLVKPASEGTGVIAGGAVRAVMQAVGVRDVRTKVLGSTNPHNVVRATFDALLRMKDPMELARLRGKQVEEM